MWPVAIEGAPVWHQINITGMTSDFCREEHLGSRRPAADVSITEELARSLLAER
jgi:hypothetical protein